MTSPQGRIMVFKVPEARKKKQKTIFTLYFNFFFLINNYTQLHQNLNNIKLQNQFIIVMFEFL